MASDNFSFIPTRCSVIKNTAVQYQEVVYQDPKKKKKHESTFLPASSGDKMLPTNQEIDMKRARFEIFKFAKRNSTMLTKQQTDKELAIKLGARVPRNKKCKNYKEILAKKQKNKVKKEKRVELKKINEKFNGKILKNKKKKKPKKKKKSSVVDDYGKPTKKMLNENIKRKRL